MTDKKKQKSTAKNKQKPKSSQELKLEYDNYLLFFHKKRVEVHIDYGGSVLKLEGILRSKARYDIQLILDSGEILNINKGYIILVKPIP